METREAERIARVEEAVKMLTYRTSKIEKTNEALLEFKAIVKMQAEISKSQEETLEKININLSEINHNQIQFKDEQSKMRKDLEKEIGEIETKVKEMDKNNKIDIPSLLNKIFVAGIMGYVLLQLGLK